MPKLRFMKRQHDNKTQCAAPAEEASPAPADETVPEAAADCAQDCADAEAMASEEQALNAEISAGGELEAALAQAAENRDLYLRAVADLDTYRRKVQREKQELSKFALQPLIEELLPSLDHLEMAIDAAKSSGEGGSITTGVEMVCAQIKKVFAGFGVEEIAAEGKPFDPNTSECVSHEPSETVAENGVIKVVRRGYLYNGRLIRPASVVVSSGKEG